MDFELNGVLYDTKKAELLFEYVIAGVAHRYTTYWMPEQRQFLLTRIFTRFGRRRRQPEYWALEITPADVKERALHYGCMTARLESLLDELDDKQ